MLYITNIASNHRQ